jgi:hypothetical protein
MSITVADRLFPGMLLSAAFLRRVGVVGDKSAKKATVDEKVNMERDESDQGEESQNKS